MTLQGSAAAQISVRKPHLGVSQKVEGVRVGLGVAHGLGLTSRYGQGRVRPRAGQGQGAV